MARYIGKVFFKAGTERKVVNTVFVVDSLSTSDSPVIEFHVRDGHGYEQQKARAIEYIAYLNSQDEAMQKAAKEVTLVDAVARRMSK